MKGQMYGGWGHMKHKELCRSSSVSHKKRGLKASVIGWAPHPSSRPVEEKDAAGDLPPRRRHWGKSVKREWHCTHMVKEPGGADTRRRSAACAWWMLEAAGNEQRRQSQQDSVDKQGTSRGEKERHTKFKQKLNERITNSDERKINM